MVATSHQLKVMSAYSIRLAKSGITVDRLLIIWKSGLSHRIKRDWSQTVAVTLLRYRCTTWKLARRLEKKNDDNYTRMQRTILNTFWKQHPHETSAA